MSWPLVLRDRRAWAVPARTLALGVYGLFGFHFLLFIALRHAPPVEANLVNYLGRSSWWCWRRCCCRACRCGRCTWWRRCSALPARPLAILGARGGHDAAARAAVTGASCRRWPRPSSGPATRSGPGACRPSPTAAIGLFGLVSGALSLVCHARPEAPRSRCRRADWLLVPRPVRPGPAGAAFFFWDMALKRGDARQIGTLSYITPLASTALLLVVTGRPLSWSIAIAAALIIVAAIMVQISDLTRRRSRKGRSPFPKALLAAHSFATCNTSLPKFSPVNSRSAPREAIDALDHVLAALHAAVLQVAGHFGHRHG